MWDVNQEQKRDPEHTSMSTCVALLTNCEKRSLWMMGPTAVFLSVARMSTSSVAGTMDVHLMVFSVLTRLRSCAIATRTRTTGSLRSGRSFGSRMASTLCACRAMLLSIAVSSLRSFWKRGCEARVHGLNLSICQLTTDSTSSVSGSSLDALHSDTGLYWAAHHGVVDKIRNAKQQSDAHGRRRSVKSASL